MKAFVYYIIVGLLFVSLFSCSEDKVDVFKDRHEVYFDKFFIDEVYPGMGTADSTVVSFFFYPDGTQDVTADLLVDLSGPTLTSDLDFGLKVIEEETTANPDEYTIDPSYTFRVGNAGSDTTMVSDIIQVKLHRSARLEDMPDGVKIVVELVPNEIVGIGQIERRRAKIILTTAVSIPDWWTPEVVNTLLGTYSQKKYKYFLNHADTEAQMSAQLIAESPDKAIQLVLKFKNWLGEQVPAITEDDGTVMTVNI